MNINQEMHSLGNIGSGAYEPSDQLVDQLLGKARRARAVRQGAATAVSAVGALALGAVAVQAINAANDDPAFRDRNIINDRSGLTPIEKYRAQYGADNPTRVLESPVDIQKLIRDLKAAAQGQQDLKNLDEKPTTPGTGGGTKPKTTTPPTEPCVAKDHPDKPYKVWDCATGDWAIKPGWFWDPYAGAFVQCSAQNSYAFATYACDQGDWVAKTGYFEFGENFYQSINWTDAATGISTTGNYVPDYNKMVVAKTTKNYYEDYRHLESYATWNGSVCSGVTTSMYGATFRFSCLPDSKISSDNGSYGNVSKNWILQSTNLKWHHELCEYKDPANPPAGWTWDGSQWVATP